VIEKVKNYLMLNDKHLSEGDALLEKGDYVQASEKFWGAIADNGSTMPKVFSSPVS